MSYFQPNACSCPNTTLGYADLGGLGAGWSPNLYDAKERDLTSVVPIPREQFIGAFAIFGMTAMAFAGKTDLKSLLGAATGGILVGMALTVATGKD